MTTNPSEISEELSTVSRQSTFRALRHRNFRLYWTGQIISQAGSWMQIVAQGWLVYRLTDSPLMLGLVTFLPLLPVAPLSLLAGVLSDHIPRRTLILITEIILALQALAMAALIWLDVIQIWHVIVLSFIMASAAAIEQPARLAFIVDTVGKEDLPSAIGLNSSMYNLARILGPTLAGVLLAAFGEAGCFLINGVSYLAVIVALLVMRLPPHAKKEDRMRLGGSLMQGLKYTWNMRQIRGLMLIVAISSFFTLPYLSLMPVFSRDVLQAGPQGLGLLMAAVGVGAILGALWVAGMGEGKRGRWLTWANLLAPLALVMFSFSRSFALSLLLVAFVGAGNAVRQTLANSLIQLTTENQYHGRVMSVFNLLFNGMSRFGALGVGAFAEVIGVPWAVGGSAVISAVLSLFLVLFMPDLDRMT